MNTVAEMTEKILSRGITPLPLELLGLSVCLSVFHSQFLCCFHGLKITSGGTQETRCGASD